MSINSSSSEPPRAESETGLLPVPEPVRDLLVHLQSNCIYSCCYLDAFDLTEPNVARWLSGVTEDQGRQALAQLRELRQQLQADRLDLAQYDHPIAGMFPADVAATLAAAEGHLACLLEGNNPAEPPKAEAPTKPPNRPSFIAFILLAILKGFMLLSVLAKAALAVAGR